MYVCRLLTRPKKNFETEAFDRNELSSRKYSLFTWTLLKTDCYSITVFVSIPAA